MLSSSFSSSRGRSGAPSNIKGGLVILDPNITAIPMPRQRQESAASPQQRRTSRSSSPWSRGNGKQRDILEKWRGRAGLVMSSNKRVRGQQQSKRRMVLEPKNSMTVSTETLPAEDPEEESTPAPPTSLPAIQRSRSFTSILRNSSSGNNGDSSKSRGAATSCATVNNDTVRYKDLGDDGGEQQQQQRFWKRLAWFGGGAAVAGTGAVTSSRRSGTRVQQENNAEQLLDVPFSTEIIFSADDTSDISSLTNPRWILLGATSDEPESYFCLGDLTSCFACDLWGGSNGAQEEEDATLVEKNEGGEEEKTKATAPEGEESSFVGCSIPSDAERKERVWKRLLRSRGSIFRAPPAFNKSKSDDRKNSSGQPQENQQDDDPLPNNATNNSNKNLAVVSRNEEQPQQQDEGDEGRCGVGGESYTFNSRTLSKKKTAAENEHKEQQQQHSDAAATSPSFWPSLFGTERKQQEQQVAHVDNSNTSTDTPEEVDHHEAALEEEGAEQDAKRKQVKATTRQRVEFSLSPRRRQERRKSASEVRVMTKDEDQDNEQVAKPSSPSQQEQQQQQQRQQRRKSTSGDASRRETTMEVAEPSIDVYEGGCYHYQDTTENGDIEDPDGAFDTMHSACLWTDPATSSWTSPSTDSFTATNTTNIDERSEAHLRVMKRQLQRQRQASQQELVW